ncbi:DUF1684 domain-containing protein [Luteimonas sp. RD2P54]|uniref:DUF1684 domain-containing protein n=1 Tax=Luteimonas endophytica TaxID=3042023 RepID=A0ABT6JBR2_9GAMM|nr:DUF1684 domain-containing protein [Luteimonas endophytica]MDH5824262.1 DUF1684 domain-containing protein [Luteimonas endophytica]
MTGKSVWIAAALAAFVAGCGRTPQSPEDAAAMAGADAEPAAETAEIAAVPGADAAFVREQEAWREQRRESLLAPDGWTGLIGLHWIELKAHYVGSGSGLRLAKGPPRIGLLQQEGGRLFFTPEKDVELTLDGEPLTGRVELHDDFSATPSTIGFDDGKGEISVIARGGRRALRVRHDEAEGRTGFAGLDYWPMDPGWRVQGKFVAHPPGRTIEIANIIGIVEAQPNPGAVEFERDGQQYRLEALEGGEGALFLILADRTNGQGSYGAGRYLYTDAPDAQGNVTLDFNRAYNPPCAFTAHATCPLPPPENRLDLRITAGEKAYAKPAS